MKRIILAFALILSGASCARNSASNDVDVFEAAFREIFRPYHEDEIVFISTGWNDRTETWNEPPRELLNRFRDLPFKVHPVSEARIPKASEMMPDGNYRGVEEKGTGKSGKVFFVRILEVGRNQYRLETGIFGGPLSGGGQEYKAIKKQGRWVLTPAGNPWVS